MARGTALSGQVAIVDSAGKPTPYFQRQWQELRSLPDTLVVEATNNTTLTFRLRGTDGIVRSATLTLS